MKRTKSFLKPKQSRQGALLLVVLSILVLFALVGLTFVVGAAAYNTGAQSNLRRDINRSTPPQELDTILMDLLRGPRAGSTSRLFMQDMLRDMWGNQSVNVTSGNSVTIARPAGTNQLWQIDIASPPTRLSPIAEFYTGSVITFTSGNAKGQSHRIVHYRPTWNGSAVSAVTLVIDQDPETVRESFRGSGMGAGQPANNDSFVINDPAFNGTGLGYNTQQASGNPDDKRNLDLRDADNHPVAYVTNLAYAYPKGWVYDSNGNPVSIEAGGLDESYDAADYQTLFLSHIPLDATPTTNGILPSFHRQDLLNFWINQLAAIDSNFAGLDATDRKALFRNPDLTTLPSSMSPPPPSLRDVVKNVRRKTILRPLIEDHPSFNGSNPNFDIFGEQANSRWDIDNDLDGVADSIWIDVGLPLKTDSQGRQYKPLAAILIKDLDGLINVNAHGFYTQFQPFMTNSLPQRNMATGIGTTPSSLTHNQFSPAWAAYTNPNNATPTPMTLPLGSGYGPADVSLLQIFTNPETAYRLIDQRYLANVISPPNPSRPGEGGVNDARSRMSEVGIPLNYLNRFNNQLGTPTDRYGIGRTYFDFAGRPRFQPAYNYGNMTAVNELTAQTLPGGFGSVQDDPYESNLIQSSHFDSSFTYQEYERIARFEEYDSSSLAKSSDRLLENAKDALGAAAGTNGVLNRRLVSVASFQVPAPNRVDIPRDLRNFSTDPELHKPQTSGGQPEVRFAPTLVGLCQKRLADNGVPTNQLNQSVRQLLPPEILRGEPLDINRLLESPPDVSGNTNIFALQTQAVAQFQTTATSADPIASNTRFTGWFNTLPMADNGAMRLPTPTGATSYSVTRQLMARHLYVIMLLLKEEGYHFPLFDTSINATDREELTKRRMAQWAINVVDFRDKDAVMTPFEFDLEPFAPATAGNPNTWNVDGNLMTNEDSSYRRVVWGAEAPDLVMTETLAFHDRGAKDTEWDNASRRKRGTDTTNDDENLDQYKIPQGSLFLEFYNPRNLLSNNPASSLPLELYNANGQLHLNRRSDSGAGAPVWRVLITEREATGGAGPASMVREMANRIDTMNFQPNSLNGTPSGDFTQSALAGMQMLPSATEDYQIDRVIYFADYQTDNLSAPPTGDPLAPGRDREFRYRGTADVLLSPNNYFVVAPRNRTVIGSRRDINEPEFNIEGSRVLELYNLNNGVGQFRETQSGPAANVIRPYPTIGSAIQQNVAIAVTMDLPDDYLSPTTAPAPADPDGAPRGLGLNISEPMRDNYYPIPEYQNPNPNVMGGLYQYYTDDTTYSAPDIPFEGPSSTYANYPLNDSNSNFNTLYKTGTYPDKSTPGTIAFAEGYKDAVLQRLANPWVTFNTTLNPYVTVDTMPIDLTVFNGEDGAQGRTGSAAMVNPEDFDPAEDGVDAQAAGTNVYFGSRERGKRDDGTVGPPTAGELNESPSNGNLMGVVSQLTAALIGNPDQISETLQQSPPIRNAARNTTFYPEEHFGRPLLHTLGYVNRSHGLPLTNAVNIGGASANLPYVGSPMPIEQRPSDPYDPTSGNTANINNNPYAWLHWANSPFVSKYDLMMVPSSSPQRLLYEYSLIRKNSGTETDAYNVSAPIAGDNVDRFFAPYTYLLNFFHGVKTHTLTSSSSTDQMSAQLARIFDFVTVPSRYNGTYKWFSVNDFNTVSSDTDARAGYGFPFNRRSMFREPGKINLNTIPAKKVYDSIFGLDFWQNTSLFASFPDWGTFQANRQGFDGSGLASDQFPSRFSNPFRSAATSEMVPDLPAGGNANLLKVAPADATVLRSRDPLQQISGTGDEQRPLFDLRLANPAATNSQINHYRTDDNPMLRYQAYQRLGNIAGTQSNVFAVWITVGYFEVEPHAVDAQHPDGWALGQELGIDTGEIERHRAFYIIDRSIPVGYLPGEDLNSEDTIMLRRFIE